MKNNIELNNYSLFRKVKNENLKWFLFDNFIRVDCLKIIKNTDSLLVISDSENELLIRDYSDKSEICVVVQDNLDGFCSRYVLGKDFKNNYVWFVK